MYSVTASKVNGASFTSSTIFSSSMIIIILHYDSIHKISMRIACSSSFLMFKRTLLPVIIPICVGTLLLLFLIMNNRLFTVKTMMLYGCMNSRTANMSTWTLGPT
jgi:hypothetical protein